MTDAPIACSLTPGERRARAAALAAFDVVETRVTGRVTVRRDARSEAALDEFVRAERACCPFFDLSVTPYADSLVLEVAGPDGAEPLIAALVQAFRGHDVPGG